MAASSEFHDLQGENKFSDQPPPLYLLNNGPGLYGTIFLPTEYFS